jgi:hypothetical protein
VTGAELLAELWAHFPPGRAWSRPVHDFLTGHTCEVAVLPGYRPRSLDELAAFATRLEGAPAVAGRAGALEAEWLAAWLRYADRTAGLVERREGFEDRVCLADWPAEGASDACAN